MTPTYCTHGFNYMPVIRHADGRREVIPGPPLANRLTATKYAALTIRDRRMALEEWKRLQEYAHAEGRD